MKKFTYQYDNYTFYVTQWNEACFDLVAYSSDVETWRYPNNIYRLADCSTHVRKFLDSKGKRIKWVECTS